MRKHLIELLEQLGITITEEGLGVYIDDANTIADNIEAIEENIAEAMTKLENATNSEDIASFQRELDGLVSMRNSNINELQKLIKKATK